MSKLTIGLLGGLGFVGTNLKLHLEKNKKFKIKVFDNYEIKSNLKYHKSARKIDFTNYKDAKKLKNLDVIIILAAQTGVNESNLYPDISIKKNIYAVSNVMRSAYLNNIKKVIFASTAGAIYGNLNKKFIEESNKDPESYYGLTKDIGERIVYYHTKKHKINSIILRFSNLYGPYSSHKTNLIHNLIKNKINNKTTNIYGDGNQTRDFIYIKDVCKIIEKMLLNFRKFEGTLNISGGNSLSVKQIINTISKIDNNKLKIKYCPKKENEIYKTSISNRKLLKKINYPRKFHFSKLQNALFETFNWYKGFYNK